MAAGAAAGAGAGAAAAGAGVAAAAAASGAGAAAVGAAGAGVGVWARAASGAAAITAASASPASRWFPKNFMSLSLCRSLERRGARLARPDAHGFRDVEDEDLSVADLAGGRRGLDGLHRLAGGGVVDHALQLHLGQEVDLVLRPPIDLGLALLPAIALDLRDRQTLHAGADERFAHVVQLERFDDRHDEFHPLALRVRPPGWANPSRIVLDRRGLNPRGGGR